MHLRSIVMLCVLGCQVASAAPADEDSAQRTRRPAEHADFFNIESIADHFGGPASVSADGQRVAFALQRAAATHVGWDRRYLTDNDRADVWVKLEGDIRPRNLTNGLQDHSGWWSPVWSPGGRYLAMLSTRRESAIGEPTLWIWDSRDNRLSQPVHESLEIDPQRAAFEWLDAESLVCMLRRGTDHEASPVAATSRAALKGWETTAEGRKSTASVLDSGLGGEVPDPQLKLVRINVGGEVSVIAETAIIGWALSPDRKHVAYPVRTRRYLPAEGDQYWFHANSDIHTIDVSTLDGRKVLRTGSSTRGLVLNSLRWSSGSRSIAFLTDTQELGAKYALVIGDVRRGTTKTLPLTGFDTSRAAGLEWWRDKAVLIRGSDSSAGAGGRKEWWAISEEGNRRKLTADMPEVPVQLWETAPYSFVGLAGGELWEIRPGGARSRSLTDRFEPRVEQVTWPVARGAPGNGRPLDATSGQSVVLLEAQADNRGGLYRFDLRTHEIARLPMPSGDVEVLGCAAACSTALVHHSSDKGLKLWLSHVGESQTRDLFTANDFLAEIESGEIRSIAYASGDGEPLKALLILPVGYSPGTRYPLITNVYPTRYSNSEVANLRLEEPEGHNFQIPAARGYVVLLPSIALRRTRAAQDPMLDLLIGVMPAVDAVVEMGIADPDRLYVMGTSFGGFATYGLVTQTNRFAAAVAIAGSPNTISHYGQFDPVTRYSQSTMEHLRNPGMLEGGQVKLGGPPWHDYWRYLRNSPILYVDRVNTPLMMIHGDLDFIAMSQAEEFFTALYRQGKPARLVRYWGEDHIISSPANVADSWDRILEWFDMHRKPARSQAAAQPRAQTSVLK